MNLTERLLFSVGPMEVIRAILPHFRANKSGGIINVSSGGGLYALPMISLYCASKFALEGFTESLAFELSSQNIFVKFTNKFYKFIKFIYTKNNYEIAFSSLTHKYLLFVIVKNWLLL